MTQDISSEIKKKVDELCLSGDKYAEIHDYENALNTYKEAWELIPSPQNEYSESTWILAAIADNAFLAKYLNSAEEALQYAMTCPSGLGNPFLHLRLGQVYFEQNRLDQAADELMRAYMGGAKEIFADEDPKYLEFLAKRATL